MQIDARETKAPLPQFVSAAARFATLPLGDRMVQLLRITFNQYAISTISIY